MFVWCIVLFHLFLWRICYMLARSFIQRTRIKRQLKTFTQIHLVGCRQGQSRQLPKATGCQRRRFLWGCGHWGYQLVAPSSRGYHLLRFVLCTKAATLKLLPKESSLKQIYIPQVCLSFSHYLSYLMVRAARPQLISLMGARFTSVFHDGMPWANPSHAVCWLSA